MTENEKDKLIKDIFDITKKNLLLVPILNNYEVIKNDNNDAIIFTAKAKDNSIQQFLCDGVIKEDETLDKRIEKVIKETEEKMKKNGFLNPQMDFLSTFNTKLFKFRLYLQDMIKGDKIIRQVNAYFVEPNNNYFYEICLSAPPMSLKVANEAVMKNLITMLTIILQNIKYNDNPMGVIQKND